MLSPETLINENICGKEKDLVEREGKVEGLSARCAGGVKLQEDGGMEQGILREMELMSLIFMPDQPEAWQAPLGWERLWAHGPRW